MKTSSKSAVEEKKRIKYAQHQEVQSHMNDVRHRFLAQWQANHRISKHKT